MCKKCLTELKNKSKDGNWEVAKLEWIAMSLDNTDVDFCICGKESAYCFLLTNKANGNTLTLGRICILNPKFNMFVGNNELIDEVTFVYCEDCKIRLNYNSVSGHIKTIKHIRYKNINDKQKELEALKELYRKCNHCSNYNIPKWKNEKCIYCNNCFDYCAKKIMKCESCKTMITQKQYMNHNKWCFDCVIKKKNMYKYIK